MQTSFDPNTVLVELTGNAANPTVDPGGNIPEAIRVNASGQVTMRIPRNSTHGLGYVIYGLATPEGTMSLTNVSQVLAGATPLNPRNRHRAAWPTSTWSPATRSPCSSIPRP